MSEFVECQNCGRRFFGENIECPYCRDAQEAAERQQTSSERAGGGCVFRVLFGGFQGVLVLIVALALFGVRQSAPGRALLAVEAIAAATLLFGLAQRRRWARQATIVFIVANAALGLFGFLQRGPISALAWGPGPLALLLFLVPFCSREARERYHR